ncbi:MAG: diguanylate cyclase [Gammaproteobacteria bacterium]|jgi:diguanylate cyclase (GGDEF)-like protein/PAS domain S-box-containing protein
MNKINPTLRITVGLVLIMMSLLLVGDLLGLVPDDSQAVVEGRKTLAESLAVQYSVTAQNKDIASIKTSMRILVERNPEVLSAALRTSEGRLLAVAGDHEKNWAEVYGENSTPTHAQVPIFNGSRKWGVVEVSFAPLHEAGFLGLHISPLAGMVGFTTVSGFFTFLLFIGRTHRNMNPNVVVPSRVTSALNSLAEGVLLLDSKEQIMLANNAFANSIGTGTDELIGKKASELGWEFTTTYEEELPWSVAIVSGMPQTGKQLRLQHESGEIKTFMVNSSPVIDSNGVNRGVMATFDDVTQLEEKNDQLQDMLGMLKKSRDEVKRRNDELQILATSDPLTGCLNRRSFFEKFETVFNAARSAGHPLTCIMADIDMFKSINDRYGHSRGDEVIKAVADALRRSLRSSDAICRYGGEEFCVIMPGMNLKDTIRTVERARSNIESLDLPITTRDSGFSVTASFGISTIEFSAETLPQIIDQADQALYVSKNSGRNCITVWESEADRSLPVRQVSFVPGISANNTHRAASGAAAEPAGNHTVAGFPADSEYRLDHDSLTGLPNRRIFQDRIIEAVEHCRNTGRYLAVMMLDLDMFKRINNALGYKVGDKLLRSVSNRIQEALRRSDSVSRLDDSISGSSIYRLGGDEFGILLAGMDCTEFTEQIVKRIIESVTKRLDIDGHEIHLTCSVGISLFPEDGMDTDTLLNNAGVALYYAKCHGHNSYQFHSKDLNRTSIENLRLENDLRHAIERGELELHYQPKVDLLTGRITGMEALARWHHPDIGMIPPDEFIPLAEDTGLIIPLGYWVLETACRTAKLWRDAGFRAISVAVNLSAIQFRQRDLLNRIHDTLRETGITPRLLELEITESTIMDDIDNASATMRALHKAGVRISIDDFGTGYSSLNHLKRFPINTVKIDRSFVHDITTDPDDATIVGAIIAMAHNMGLCVVAEGVETDEQLAFLGKLRCNEIQGFLFSQAVPQHEAEVLLECGGYANNAAQAGVLAAS